MKTFISAIALFIWSAITMATVSAAPLDGVWRDREERFTIRIESTDNGIRTQRSGQDTWDHYTSTGNSSYTNSKGNTFAVKGENEIVWREKSSGAQIVYLRMYKTPVPANTNPGSTSSRTRDGNTRTNPRYEERQRDQRDDRWEDDADDRYNDRYVDRHASRFANLSGQWFNQRNRQTIHIQAANNGLRVYKEDRGRAMLFAPSRDSKVFRSRNGSTLTWLNDHTIQMRTAGNQNLIFHRADGKQVTKGHKEKHKHGRGHAYGHAKKSK